MIFAIVLATVVESNGHAVHLLHAVRPRPDYPRDVGNFKDKFHSVDAVRPPENYPLNERLLKDLLHVQHLNPQLSHIHKNMGIAHNPLFMRDKRSELKKKKRNEKQKTKKTKAGKNKGGGDDDKESSGKKEDSSPPKKGGRRN